MAATVQEHETKLAEAAAMLASTAMEVLDSSTQAHRGMP
jgi:hypothetical protein